MTLVSAQFLMMKLLSQAGTPVVLIDGSNAVNADPESLINKITTIGLSLGVAVAVVLIAIGGYKMLSSKGDAKQIQDAQDQIQNAIMGFVLILAAVTVVRMILIALGLTDVVNIK